MKKAIIIRYSEIHLKGNNRGFFENALLTNIKKSLLGIRYELLKQQGRYLIVNFDENDEILIIEKLKKVFGIHSLSSALETSSTVDEIFQCVKALAGREGTFRINTNRADKAFPMKSMELSAEIGGMLLESNPQLKVNLHNPDWSVNIDVRENGKTLVYSDSIKAVNGMPVGTSGKGLLLLSGGIDSPVAGYMMAKRGMTIRGLHFHSYPFTGLRAKEKVMDLAKKLTEYTAEFAVETVSVTEIQTTIHEKCPEDLMITLLRRFMMRIANKIAQREGCGAIVTGESLGQVASQTLESINVTNAVAQKPVFRPLIGFDKDEIIETARKIGTFETSILPYEDCCTVFLPKNPVTKPKLENVIRAESSLDIDGLIERALSTSETEIFKH